MRFQGSKDCLVYLELTSQISYQPSIYIQPLGGNVLSPAKRETDQATQMRIAYPLTQAQHPS